MVPLVLAAWAAPAPAPGKDEPRTPPSKPAPAEPAPRPVPEPPVIPPRYLPSRPEDWLPLPSASVQCCALPLPDGRARFDSPWTVRSVELSSGCFTLEIQHSPISGLLYMEGQPLYELHLTGSTCEAVPSELEVRELAGRVDLREIPGATRGSLSGCGEWEMPFGPDGRFQGQIFEPEGCRLNALVFLEDGGSVSAEDRIWKGQRRLRWKLEPESVSRMHRAQLVVDASLERDAAGALVRLFLGWSNLPASDSPVPGYYTWLLEDGLRIVAIDGQEIARMRGREFVLAAGALLRSVERGHPLPFERWTD